MATKKATPAQLAARKKFVEMVRSGAFKKNSLNKRKNNPKPQYKTIQEGIDASIKRFANSLQHWIKEGYSYDEALKRVKESSSLGPASIKKAIEIIGYKTNPRKKTVSQKISQLTHEGYPQKQAVAVALSEMRKGKVKSNPRSPLKKSKVSAVVLMNNPRAKKTQKFYQVSIMQDGLHKTWMPIANFFTFSEAENYSHYLAKTHKNWSIRVHDKRAM